MGIFTRRRKSEPVRLPPNVRLAQQAVIDNDVLARRLCSLAQHELLEWTEMSAIGADAALQNYRKLPSLEGAHQVHALSEQLFALSFELHRREQEKDTRGHAGLGGSAGSPVRGAAPTRN
jgi:hypothetical protein